MSQEVLFDISSKSFDFARLIVPGLIALFGIGRILLGMFRDKAAEIAQGAVPAIVGCLLSLCFAYQLLHFEQMKRQYAAGQYLITEGYVSRFSFAKSGNKSDVFVVDGQKFEVGPLLLSPGYNLMVRDGGHDLSDQCVSIKRTPTNEILWLAIVDCARFRSSS